MESLAPFIFRDTFQLINNYRDPFFGKTLNLQKRPLKRSPVNNPDNKIIRTIQDDNFPPVSFSGMVRNSESGKELAMIQINGQHHLMNSGDRISDIKLVRIFRDSIEVLWEKEKRMIRK